jgi:hypothetical protein
VLVPLDPDRVASTSRHRRIATAERHCNEWLDFRDMVAEGGGA